MPGLFILSLDTEIAWGTYGDRALARLQADFDAVRAVTDRLLALLDRYTIPATWAVVGHLFLDRCDGHPDLRQPHYAWADGPDSRRDPCSDVDHAPWYYAPDLIAAIRGASVPHEIGTHTFTHVLPGDPAVTADIWRSQLAACAVLHAAHGLPMRALVPPQETIAPAHIAALPEHGIIAYRGEEQNWYRGFRSPFKRLGHFVDRALGLPAPTYDLRRLQEGPALVNLPASQFLMPYAGVRRLIPTASRVRQARLALDRAERCGELYHLWFHPFNLASGAAMFTALEAILQDATRRRDAGRLRVLTMAQAAEWILETDLGD